MRLTPAAGIGPLCAFVLGATAARAEEPEPEPEPGVVVHDPKLERASRRDASAASTVIRRERLERPGADAADALAHVPGVQVARSGASSDVATASLRGASSAQTPVYLAGIRLNDDVSGTADLSRIPLWMLDRVEVFRGSVPEDVDRLGIGGAVLFEPRYARRSSLAAGAAVGSFGQRALWAGGALVGEGSSSQVSLRTEHADNDYEYVDDAGTVSTTVDDRTRSRTNADATSWDAWAIGRSDVGRRGRVVTVLNAFAREQGVTGLGVIPARYARARVERLLAGISARLPCRAEGDACELELATTGLAAAESLRDPFEELSLGAAALATQGKRVAQNVHLVLRPEDELRLRFGGGEELELLRIDRVGAPGLRARRDVSRADLSLRYALSPSLELGALGALECHGTTGPDKDERCDVLAPTGRLGVVARPAESLSLLANVGRSLRVPTLGELFGQSALVVGNPELEPEKGWTVDAGARWSIAGRRAMLWVEGFVFAREVRDLVAYRRASFGAARPYNVGRARVLGLELTSALRALDHVLFEASATLLDPRDVTAGRQLTNDVIPFQSRLAAAGRLELFHEPGSLADRVAIAASTRYRASRVADPAGLIVLGEQWNVGADATLLTWSRRLGLRAAVDNVLDRTDVDTVGYPLPGRSYHASAELSW